MKSISLQCETSDTTPQRVQAWACAQSPKDGSAFSRALFDSPGFVFVFLFLLRWFEFLGITPSC